MSAPTIHLVGGIRTWAGKYWNCEKFNFQLTSNAAVLKQKQTFTLEPTDDGKWRIKSWLNKYLSAHELGEVSIKSDEAGPSETFSLEFLKGLVAIKSVHGKYISADENNITCKAASIGERELFDIVFSIHPQVVIRSSEGRFVRTEGDDVVANKEQQFGVSTLITLEYESNGKYAFRATSGKYFSVDDSKTLKATSTEKGEKELFWFELVGKKVAIRSTNGNYVTPDGAKGTLKTKGDKITPRELFDLAYSDPQVTLKAHNGKYVSSQEKNVMCNRTEAGDDETFILEHIKEDTYAIRAVQGKYWSNKDGAIVVESDQRGESEIFTVGYQDGKTFFKSTAGGKPMFVSAKALGGVRAVGADAPTENELFDVVLLNRPLLVLRSKQLGFVGTTGEKLLTNKTAAEALTMEAKEGKYILRNAAGDFISLGADAVLTSPRDQSPLSLEFVNGKLAFRTSDGEYLVSDDQGNFIVSHGNSSPPAEAQFEF